MARRTQEVDVLERGDIFFIYRPDVEEESPSDSGDVQRFYVVLHPRRARRYRLIAIGRKALPDVEGKGEQFWAFVSRVCRGSDEAREEFAGKTYQTKTRGERHQPPARPAGEGVYAVVRHGDHTHLAYVLELPEEPGEVQRALNIEAEASYILSVKNPEAGSPSGAGLSEDQQAKFPKTLQERFGGRRFIAVDPPEFLNHDGAELLLIAASDDVDEELGISLDPQDEDENKAEVFEELRLKKSKQTVKPLVEGAWA